MKTTIIDIARRCGVGKSTVSRILSGNAALHNEKVVTIVRKAALEMSYRPNMAARTFVKGHSAIIGMVGVSHPIRFFANLRRSLEISINAKGFLPVSLCPLPDQRKSVSEIVKTLLNFRAEGAIVIPGENDKLEDYIEFQKNNIPVVFANLPMPGNMSCNFVGTDDRAGGSLAARRFLEQGHRKALVAMNNKHLQIDFDERYAGFAETFIAGGGTCESSLGGIEHILDEMNGATAVFAVSDQIAKKIVLAAWNAGISIPDDFSLIGFGDKDECYGMTPPLTIIAQDGQQIGVYAAKLLFEKIEKGAEASKDMQQLRFAPNLLIGKSDAPYTKQ